jgi:hypothetical protein
VRRIRASIAFRLRRAAGWLRGFFPPKRYPIKLDFPVSPRSRWGFGAPPLEPIRALLDASRDRYREHLERIVDLREQLAAIRVLDIPQSAVEPVWINSWFTGLDAAALYMFLTHTNPALYLEVGSGFSTRFARKAIRDHGLRTRIVSIDPEPRAEIDQLCDEVIRMPMEDLALTTFDRLAPGDVFFVDSSHRAFQNSDVTVVFLDVFPRLPSGILVQIHDIVLPDDYPPEWNDRYYSEQYLLAAYLLGGAHRMKIELPNHYVNGDPDLAAELDPLWNDPRLERVEHSGASFWFTIC